MIYFTVLNTKSTKLSQNSVKLYCKNNIEKASAIVKHLPLTQHFTSSAYVVYIDD